MSLSFLSPKNSRESIIYAAIWKGNISLSMLHTQTFRWNQCIEICIIERIGTTLKFGYGADWHVLYMESYNRSLKRVDCNTWWWVFLLLLSTHATFEKSSTKIHLQLCMIWLKKRNLGITVNAWTKNGTHLAVANSLRLLWLVTPIFSSGLHSISLIALNSLLKTRLRHKYRLSFSGATAYILPTLSTSFRLSNLSPFEHWDHHVHSWEDFRSWLFSSEYRITEFGLHCRQLNLTSTARWKFATIFPRAFNIMYCTKNCLACTGHIIHSAKTIFIYLVMNLHMATDPGHRPAASIFLSG